MTKSIYTFSLDEDKASLLEIQAIKDFLNRKEEKIRKKMKSDKSQWISYEEPKYETTEYSDLKDAALKLFISYPEKETKDPEESKIGYYLWSTKPFNELKKGDYIYECPYRGRFANTKKPPFILTNVRIEDNGTVTLEYYNGDCKTTHNSLPPKAYYILNRLYEYCPIEETVEEYIKEQIAKETSK